VSPVRDEVVNLPRLADSLALQTLLPETWVIVDNGSADGTTDLAHELSLAHPEIRLLKLPGARTARRGAPIVRAFAAGVALLGSLPDVVVKLDADLSMEADYFERLLAEFARDKRLGIASGLCWERVDGEWRPQYATRDHVRGAARAYRRECLGQVTPLVERIGWDGIDELKAQTHGWRVRTIPELVLYHHRSLGERDRRVSKWVEQGDMAYFMWYRPTYLLARALYRAARDPAAAAMVYGYTRGVVTRAERYDDEKVRALVREVQAWRNLPHRAREARGRA
jgi:GT2 family glycosyltransferase